MNWWEALTLGIVEGITEYLPVSSTGHLLLTQRLLGFSNGKIANAYAICIQAGAILAVLGLYAARVKAMLQGLVGRDRDGARLVLCLCAAFAPAAVIGMLFDKRIEQYLFGLWPIVGAWFVGGLVILWFARRPLAPGRALTSLTWQHAALIGLAQCVAMWPGTSRSLVTILAGVLLGLSLQAAVEFSFLLGMITLSAATGYKALQHGPEMLQAYGAQSIFIGFAAAWLSAVLAVRWMVNYLNKHGLLVFAYWRLALATAVAALLVLGFV